MTRAKTATTTAATPTSRPGGVAFVGTGPGDPELLTVRALRLIEEAQVLITEAPEHLDLIARLRGTRIGTLPQALYAAKRYLETLPAGHTFQDHDWIGWGKEAANSASARWLKANLPDAANVSAEVNSWDAFKEAVVCGLGIGHMWCFVADREPALVRIRDIEPELSMGLWLLVRDDVPPDSRTKRLMEFLAPAMVRRVGG